MNVHGSKRTNLQIFFKKHLPEIVAVTATIAAGAFSWLVILPGESLVWPIVVDVLILTSVAVGIQLMRRILTFEQRQHRHVWLGCLGLASILWSYFGVLPIHVIFDAAAVSEARHEIAISAHGCHFVEKGSVGSMNAPYQVCTHIDQLGSAVTFRMGPRAVGGYAFVTGATNASWDPDGCSRHLIGNWWAYSIPATAGSGCPLGYGTQGV